MRTGFTLLELMVVLVIVGLLTAVAVVRLQAPYRAARLEDSLSRIEFIDSQTRAHARAFAQDSTIVFQLDSGRIYSQKSTETDAKRFEFVLPASLRIRHVMTPQLEVDHSQAQIKVSARGATRSYAICIQAADDTQRWLLFSGLTGQVTYPKAEYDVRQMFELLQASRPDAD